MKWIIKLSAVFIFPILISCSSENEGGTNNLVRTAEDFIGAYEFDPNNGSSDGNGPLPDCDHDPDSAPSVQPGSTDDTILLDNVLSYNGILSAIEVVAKTGEVATALVDFSFGPVDVGGFLGIVEITDCSGTFAGMVGEETLTIICRYSIDESSDNLEICALRLIKD